MRYIVAAAILLILTVVLCLITCDRTPGQTQWKAIHDSATQPDSEVAR